VAAAHGEQGEAVRAHEMPGQRFSRGVSHSTPKRLPGPCRQAASWNVRFAELFFLALDAPLAGAWRARIQTELTGCFFATGTICPSPASFAFRPRAAAKAKKLEAKAAAAVEGTAKAKDAEYTSL
jgi:hypothetical protein